MLEKFPFQGQETPTRRDSRILAGTISSVITPIFMKGKRYEIMLDILEDAAMFYSQGETAVAAEFMLHAQNVALRYAQEIHERAPVQLPARQCRKRCARRG